MAASLVASPAPKGWLNDQERDLFYEQGYVIKRAALSAEELARLSRAVDSVLERASQSIESLECRNPEAREEYLSLDGAIVAFRKGVDSASSIARINGCGALQSDLVEILRGEKMLHTFFELLGTSELEQLISQLHPKLPGDGVGYPRHRDLNNRTYVDPQWDDFLGNGSYAICVVPIDPMGPENGGLWVDPSHFSSKVEELPEIWTMVERRTWLKLEPGDLLFLHPHLDHGSEPNDSLTQSRRTLLSGFCAFGANHKPYPGSEVNQQVVLTEEGTIEVQPAPWASQPWVAPGPIHKPGS